MGRGGEAANLSSKKETKDWGERVDADPHMCFQEQNFSALALNGHEFEQALGDSDGQGSPACCSPWGHKESDTTEQLN